MSLRNLSKLALISHSVDREGLPTHLIDEVTKMEKIIITEMTGDFTYRDRFYFTKLHIGWFDGGWQFSLLNQEVIHIRAGRRECLGLSAGELFLFNKRKVTVDYWTCDHHEKKINFYGVCSSAKASGGRPFRSSITFYKYPNISWMKIRSVVVGEGGQEKVRSRMFSSKDVNSIDEILSRNIGNTRESDSDSSVDYEDVNLYE